MLKLILLATDSEEEVELFMEHSLVSLSKWEATYEKPFFGPKGMEHDETVTYINLMLLHPSMPNNWIERLDSSHYLAVSKYINSKQTATTVREDTSKKANNQIVTAELIYSWMIAFEIPFKPCDEWHLNQLMTLIKVRGAQQTKQKPMSKQARAAEYQRLNAQRREQLGTTG